MGLFFSTKAHDLALRQFADHALTLRKNADRAVFKTIDYASKHNLARKKRWTKSEKQMMKLLESNEKVWEALATNSESHLDKMFNRWGV